MPPVNEIRFIRTSYSFYCCCCCMYLVVCLASFLVKPLSCAAWYICSGHITEQALIKNRLVRNLAYWLHFLAEVGSKTSSLWLFASAEVSYFRRYEVLKERTSRFVSLQICPIFLVMVNFLLLQICSHHFFLVLSSLLKGIPSLAGHDILFCCLLLLLL
jgi:hypothetical protein